jgi:cyclophilin family peptidyl-prolyl cis-trans isomerase
MANRGSRHTNTSQFYITFDECKWCGTCLIHSGARHSS